MYHCSGLALLAEHSVDVPTMFFWRVLWFLSTNWTVFRWFIISLLAFLFSRENPSIYFFGRAGRWFRFLHDSFPIWEICSCSIRAETTACMKSSKASCRHSSGVLLNSSQYNLRLSASSWVRYRLRGIRALYQGLSSMSSVSDTDIVLILC